MEVSTTYDPFDPLNQTAITGINALIKVDTEVIRDEQPVKPSVSVGTKVKVGTSMYVVTDPYGIRPNTEEHSTGIDLGVLNPNKTITAFTDGIIERVGLQGDGTVKRAFQKDANGKILKEAGYFLVIKDNKGFRHFYMHLDDAPQDLVGRRIKRGDTIATIKRGSGTQTGPHLKYRVVNSRQEHIDPTYFITQK